MRNHGLLTAALALAMFAASTSAPATDRKRLQQTAAIHPEIMDGGATYDPQGRPVARAPITRTKPAPPVLTRLAIADDGLSAGGIGYPGQTVRLVHNRRVLASVTVGHRSTWRVNVPRRFAAGDHRFIVEAPSDGRTLPEIGDELRISIPPGHAGTINVQFNDEERLRRHAQTIGEEATRIFDKFLSRQNDDGAGKRLAQSTTSSRRPEADDVMDDPWDWLGNSNATFQNEIVPRLQLGGGLVLPPPGERDTQRHAVRLQRLAFPTIDTVTERLQVWFGNSAANYDGQILPRLSGARAPAIVLTKPREVKDDEPDQDQLAAVQERAERERLAAEASRRAAELARRRAEAEQQRIAAETRARREREAAEQERQLEIIEQERAEAVRREREDRARLASEQATRERAEAERQRARTARLQAEAERSAAQDRQRAAEEEAERQRRAAEAERQRRTEVALLPPVPQRNTRSRTSPRNVVAPPTRNAEPPTSRLRDIWRRARRLALGDANRNSRSPTGSRSRQTQRVTIPTPDRRPQRPVLAERSGRADQSPTVAEERPVRTARAGRQKVYRVARRRAGSRRAKRRRTAVRSYRKRLHRSCRYRSRWRVRLPGKYVVRRGDSLWRIARRHYRRGHRYKRIYWANRRKIRNPHLIYPCQRFYIPRGKRVARRR